MHSTQQRSVIIFKLKSQHFIQDHPSATSLSTRDPTRLNKIIPNWYFSLPHTLAPSLCPVLQVSSTCFRTWCWPVLPLNVPLGSFQSNVTCLPATPILPPAIHISLFCFVYPQSSSLFSLSLYLL